MKVGYLRVSTSGQNLDRQEVIAEKLGVEKVFSDKLSGKNTNRPQLKAMLDFLREGDTLVVESISRLARSTRDLLSIVDTLTQKKISFISQKENIDTNSPQGRFVLTIFSALAELERETILERQKEGVAIAKEKGKVFGRPKFNKPENWDSVISDYKNGKLTASEAIEMLKIKRSTFYKFLKK